MQKVTLWSLTVLSLFSNPSISSEKTSNIQSLEDLQVIEEPQQEVSSVKLLPENSFGFKDTSEVLKQIPGANINRNGVLTGIPQLRGLFGSRVNVSFDGFHLKEAGPNSMDTPMSHIPVSLVNSVSVHRGITPVSEGIETIGGSIKIAPKSFSDSDDSFIADLGLGYSSVDQGKNLSLYLASNQNNHKFYLGADSLDGDSYDFAKGINYFTGYERNHIVSGYSFTANEHEISAEVSYNDTGETGTPALPMDIIYVRGGDIKLNHSAQLSDSWKLQNRLSYQNTRHIMNNYRFRNAMNQREADTEVHSRAYGVNLQKDWQSGSFVVGLEGDFSDHRAIIADPQNTMFRIQNFNAERNRNSLFVETDYKFSDEVHVNAGLRYTNVSMNSKEVSTSMAMMNSMMGMMHRTLRDRFNNAKRNKNDNNFDAAFNLRHGLSKNLNINYSLGFKSRSPSYQERYLWLPMEATAGMADGLRYFGNLNLKPEKAHQIDIGLDYNNGKFTIAPHIFYSQVNDFIQGTPTTTRPTPPGTLTFNNVDAKFYGIDLNLNYQLSNHWTFANTTSFVRGQRRDINDNIYRVAPPNTRLQLSYDKSSWSLASELIAYQKQNKVSTTNNEKTTSGYALLNLKSMYKWSQNTTVVFGVNNVFDRHYQNHLNGYNRNNLNSDIGFNPTDLQSYRLPGQGRNIYLNILFNW